VALRPGSAAKDRQPGDPVIIECSFAYYFLTC
jgi:hypothetical protein